MDDLISRQAAIDALKGLPTWCADEGGYYGEAQLPMVALLDPEDAVSAIENLLSVQPQPEEDCATCKHGYFGDRQCDNCRVRYPSHYEREEVKLKGAFEKVMDREEKAVLAYSKGTRITPSGTEYVEARLNQLRQAAIDALENTKEVAR